MDLVASVPTERLMTALSDVDGVRRVLWEMTGPPPRAELDLVVTPYMVPAGKTIPWLKDVRVRVVQLQTIGYDGVLELLPDGPVLANAASVHESSTAELALGLMISAQRRLDEYARAQPRGEWLTGGSAALADSHVLVIGQGGVGKAVGARLAPFEVSVTRLASTRREDAEGVVHGFDELAGLLPDADVVVLAVPLTDATRHLVDAGFLAAMKPGALLVNVSRGPVVDTAALVDAVRAGRVRAALDVLDPEPLPADHPLWTLPGVLISPHVGGNSAAMAPRVESLIRSQLAALRTGTPLRNIIRA